MADLQELFSRLKAQSSDQSQAQSQSPTPSQPALWASSHLHQQPSVSSPILSPPIYTPNPAHSSHIISPVQPSSATGTPGPDPNRTANLLNLLKFNGQPSQGPPSQLGPMASLHNIGGSRSSSTNAASLEVKESSATRPLSASDLMATLQRQSSSSVQATAPAAAASGVEAVASPSPNPQDILLNLLTRPKGQQPQLSPIGPPQPIKVDATEKQKPEMDILAKRLAETAIKSSGIPREPTPTRQPESPSQGTTRFEAPQPTKVTMFNYVNPFDQLHSSSPLNRAPKPASPLEPKRFEIMKHNRDVSSSTSGPPSAPASKNRKIEDGDVATAALPMDGESKNRSVSEVLEGVGEKVDKQVEKALAEADARLAPNASKSVASTNGAGIKQEQGAQKAAVSNEDVESSWESAGDEDDASKEDDYNVDVYNFPMKPFVSLQIKNTPTVRSIRQDNFMVIAQLKKEFDQIDRCLVTASQAHIVYAQVATKKDNGGFRVIRQDSGKHKQVFRSSGERVFSVQLCTVPGTAHDVETVLGTGVNGSVFWTLLTKSRGDVFADDDLEAQGFVLPPITTAEENTSGSPVKTRARLSSRHPEFFAVARGKQIFIVSPQMAKDPRYCVNAASRKVDSEKFFADHSLKINTGKAGKDFCFSEDDTVIASLDKNGRFKFWDIRDLTSRASDLIRDKHEPFELREPMWTMNAAASGSKPEEKPSVSSIMFLDKERPVVKGSALRYMIIGFKQNHILQLWDLGLGKAVQEIRLPHEKDSDGICSISYHPKHGIIAIGHPTRNSIYFVHLSAPKYNIPTMEQARYINMIASNDPALPKPESTAIMSGLREFSLAKVGQLRSIDMLKTPVENASERNSPDETLFELYLMHSKGTVGISIKRADLGWDEQNKVVNPKDAKAEGLIEVTDLIQPPKLPTSSEQGNTSEVASKSSAKSTKVPIVQKAETKKDPILASQASTSNVGAKDFAPEKASKQTQPQSQLPTQPSAGDLNALHLEQKKSLGMEKLPQIAPVEPPATAQAAAAIPAPSSSDDFRAALKKQFDSLYQRIDADKRVQDAAAGAKQEALLRLVSSTLTENVDQSLSSIISARIEKDVVPVLAETTSKLVNQKLTELLPQSVNTSITGVIKTALPNALQQVLTNKDMHRTISDMTAKQVASNVQQQVSQLLQEALPNMATQATQQMVTDLEARTNQQLQKAAAQQQQDNQKIEELSSLVRSLSTIVQNMADSQSAFQEEILKMQRENKTQSQYFSVEGSAGSVASNAVANVQSPQSEPVDEDIVQMTQLLTSGRYEEATIQWISSDRQAEIFDKLFVRVDPSYLQLLSPLVALTVSAAITSSFDTFTEKRLEWLGRVLGQIDIRDSEIMDVAPKIMDVLSQRLQGIYMELSEAEPGNPSLKDIATLNRQVGEIRRLAG